MAESGILMWIPDASGTIWPVIVALQGDVWSWVRDPDAREYLELLLEENELQVGGMLQVSFERTAAGPEVMTAKPMGGLTQLLTGVRVVDGEPLTLDDVEFRVHKGTVQHRPRAADGTPWTAVASVAEFSDRILGERLGAEELKSLLGVLFDEHRLDLLLLPNEPGFLLVPSVPDGFPGSPLDIVADLYRAAKQLEGYRRTFTSDEIFVNPFNFVPLPDAVVRTEPVDRSVLTAGRRMGHLDVEWVAATPLLFGNGVGDDRTGLEQDEDEADRYRVAGSSLKGAVSSLHEALCGSCLRVTDLDFVPAYRETRRPWRRLLGTGALRDRVPRDAVTCGDDGALDVVCPSCELFGAIAGAGSDDPAASAVHHALRGLVRFSHLTVDTGGRALETRALPPRGAPSMGAGQFYLAIENTAPGDPPTAQWGSAHDATAAGLRRMRGRKFYWHADSQEVDMVGGVWSRAEARPHHLERAEARPHHAQGAGMGAQQVELVPAGSTVRARLHFENLDDRQLGSLIAAIAPDLALRQFLPTTWIDTSGTGTRRKLRTHLGGGKPLGLGSVEARTVSVHVENERYRSGASATALTAEEISELASAFVASITERGSDQLVVLAAMLDPDRVPPDRVSYPPGGRWGAVTPTDFDAPFTFFATTRGKAAGKNHGPIVALPRPESNPWLNIDGFPAGGDDV